MLKRSLPTTLSRLRVGQGAQKLPTPPLQVVEIRGVPVKNAAKAQRAFLKSILPRIKFWNDQVEFQMKLAAPIPSGILRGESTVQDEVTSTNTEGETPRILLHFGE